MRMVTQPVISNQYYVTFVDMLAQWQVIDFLQVPQQMEHENLVGGIN